MSGFDSSDDESGEVFDETPLKIDWLDLSAYGCVEELGVGGLPGCRYKDTWRKMKTDIDQLKKEGVKEVFSFCTRGELHKYRAQWLCSELTGADIAVHQYAFPDGGTPMVPALLKLLDELRICLMQGQRPYIHCYGGLGRSGLVAVCLLQSLDPSMSVDESIERVRKLRGPGAIQSVKQYNFVNEFRSAVKEQEKYEDERSRSVSR